MQAAKPFITLNNSEDGETYKLEEIKHGPHIMSPQHTISPFDHGSRDPKSLHSRGQALFSETDFGYLNESAHNAIQDEKPYQMNQTIEMKAQGTPQKSESGQAPMVSVKAGLSVHDQVNVGSAAKLNTGGLASLEAKVVPKDSPARQKIEAWQKSRKMPKAAPVRIQKHLSESLESGGAEATKSSGTMSRVGSLPPLQLSARNSVQMQLHNQLDQGANNRIEFSPANFDISRPMNFESRNPGLKVET